MKKTIIKTILAAGIAAIAIPASAKTELQWWHAMGGRLGEVVDEIATNYNASQSEYEIIPTYKGGYEDTMTAGIAAFRAKQQPHIIQIFDAGAATIINAPGATIPVADLMQEYGKGFDIEDYIEGVRYFYADSAGKMIGMPFNASTPLLYFNKEAFAKAGITNPPATWEEFEEMAPKLKAAGYTALAQSHSPWILSENFHSRHNLQLATGNNGYDSTDVEILYNNDSMKMHWGKMKEWLDNGHYGFYGRAWGDNQDAFVQKKVAMWMGSSGSFGGLKKSTDFEFGTTFLPYWKSVIDEPKGTFIGGAALFAMSGKPDAEYKGVADFFSYMTNPANQVFWHKETGYVPITTAAYDVAKAEGYYNESPDAEVGILQLSQPGGEWTKGYRLGYYVQIRDVMYSKFDDIFSGKSSVDDAFAEMEAESNKLLARFAATYK
ncbi:extracellular solute-binding protein [Amylibacter sp.]|jgi:sn-glycerol 3-phosphate transport system substrate-binding protein|nr:extracellular solute-binding protein [Amylibacter sp.]MDA9329640.1 extracellular solute-binding protein [Amylibacter sp.]MDB2320886.1 extracellular solute-binding protein [Amylibacter sp.]MDB4146449.1 extracellular solute-binding protein [Amylibacter sp.]MDB4184647.1 extracellular solute-binding protein [Amylibacter sp.]|tara:strand:- start:1150 stop:2454 length:1305 start_codon:yes stop_codon:yes gene_type:complete